MEPSKASGKQSWLYAQKMMRSVANVLQARFCTICLLYAKLQLTPPCMYHQTVILCPTNNNNSSNNNILQAFQLIVLAKYLLGVPNPSPVSQHALT